MEKLELWYFEMLNGAAVMGNNMTVPQKLNIELLYDQFYLYVHHLNIWGQELKLMDVPHCSYWHCSPSQSTQISERWMDKQIIELTYNMHVTMDTYCHKREWNSSIRYTVDESWLHYAKWNKPDTKGKISCIPILLRYLK
jgi:hypothetical protein